MNGGALDHKNMSEPVAGEQARQPGNGIREAACHAAMKGCPICFAWIFFACRHFALLSFQVVSSCDVHVVTPVTIIPQLSVEHGFYG